MAAKKSSVGAEAPDEQRRVTAGRSRHTMTDREEKSVEPPLDGRRVRHEGEGGDLGSPQQRKVGLTGAAQPVPADSIGTRAPAPRMPARCSWCSDTATTTAVGVPACAECATSRWIRVRQWLANVRRICERKEGRHARR